MKDSQLKFSVFQELLKVKGHMPIQELLRDAQLTVDWLNDKVTFDEDKTQPKPEPEPAQDKVESEEQTNWKQLEELLRRRSSPPFYPQPSIWETFPHPYTRNVPPGINDPWTVRYSAASDPANFKQPDIFKSFNTAQGERVVMFLRSQ